MPGDDAVPPSDRPDGVIVGTLIDAAGASLAGQQIMLAVESAVSAASVARFDAGRAAATVVHTNGRGEFTFDVSSEGHYTLTNLSETTGAFARVAVVRADDGTLVSHGRVELQALQLGAISGRVADEGAGVLVFLAGTSFVALTDAAGAFTIGRVPAGSYLVAASVAGAVGTAEAVMVAPGAVSELENDLRIGPSITGVTPDTLLFVDDYVDGMTLPDFTIHGSGFGDRQGTSFVHYAGFVLDRFAVSFWSDTAISLRGAVIDGSISASGWLLPSESRVPEDLRFTVVTAAGESTSDVTGVLRMPHFGYAMSWQAEPMSMFAPIHSLGWLTIRFISVHVQATNAMVLALESDAEISSFVTALDAPSFRLLSDGPLPVVLTLDASLDARFADAVPHRSVLNRPSILLQNHHFTSGTNTISGQLYSEVFADPMPDDGSFTIRIRQAEDDSAQDVSVPSAVPLALASDGSFSVDVDVAASTVRLHVEVLYDGLPTSHAWLQRPYGF